MRKALFWDFDGVLVHADTQFFNDLVAGLRAHHVAFDAEEVRLHLNRGLTWHAPERIYPESTGEKWWGRLFAHLGGLYRQLGVAVADGDAINAYIRQQSLSLRNYTLYEDAAAVLQACVDLGFENYIVSNNFPELPCVIRELGLAGFFVDYIISSHIGVEKPRVEIFQHALRVAGAPEVCYMIGDNPVADIQGGKAAGMRTILVHRDGDFEADFRCGGLREIPGVLGQQGQ